MVRSCSVMAAMTLTVVPISGGLARLGRRGMLELTGLSAAVPRRHKVGCWRDHSDEASSGPAVGRFSARGSELRRSAEV